MPILPIVIYRFSEIPLKIPIAFLIEIEKNNSKVYMDPQKTLNSQSNLEKEKQSWIHHTF